MKGAAIVLSDLLDQGGQERWKRAHDSGIEADMMSPRHNCKRI